MSLYYLAQALGRAEIDTGNSSGETRGESLDGEPFPEFLATVPSWVLRRRANQEMFPGDTGSQKIKRTAAS